MGSPKAPLFTGKAGDLCYSDSHASGLDTLSIELADGPVWGGFLPILNGYPVMSDDDSTREIDVDPLTLWRRKSIYCAPSHKQAARRAAFRAIDDVIDMIGSDAGLTSRAGSGPRARSGEQPRSWESIAEDAKAGNGRAMVLLADLARKSTAEMPIDYKMVGDETDEEWGVGHELAATLIWLACAQKASGSPPAVGLRLLLAFEDVPHELRDQAWHDCIGAVIRRYCLHTSTAMDIARELGMLDEIEKMLSVKISQKIKNESDRAEDELDAIVSDSRRNQEKSLLASAPLRTARWTSARPEHLPSELRKAFAPLCEPLALKPWPKSADLRADLLREFPWLGDAIAQLCDDLELQEAVSGAAIRVRPLVLLGAPGCGKSRLLNRLVDLHGGMSINMAGMSDNRLIAGTARGWSTQYPAAVSVAAARSAMANPIVGLDELDKIGELDGRNGDPRQTLLTLMEPTTAKAWLDEGLGAAIDASRVSWVATANDKSRIPALLRSRLRFVDCPAPRPCDFDVLWLGCLSDIAAELNVEAEYLPTIDPLVVGAARDGFQRGRLSARSLARVVRIALQEAGKAERAMPRN